MATAPTRSPQQQQQQEEQQSPGLDRPLKDGERLLAPSRRPDGTLRKPIRIRAGYTPQDEVAIYQSKGALSRRGQPQVPPGYDPVDDGPQRAKTKSAKKNQKRKEKKHQTDTASSTENGEAAENPCSDPGLQDRNKEDIEAVAHQMGSMSVSDNSAEKPEEKQSSPEKVNMEKRIRALRKKIRAIESLQVSLSTKGAMNSEQAEKISRLEVYQQELRELEAQNRLL
eukprot:c10261_g1_i1 orf=568-1245(-)